MSESKKYYYFKLKDNFFESDEMKMLQSYNLGKNEGYVYSDILLKMYLKSLKNDGVLLFKGMIPYSPEMLSTVTNHSIGEVKDALQKFESLGLITKVDNGTIFMNDIQLFVGKSSTEADRIRNFRKKVEAKKLSENNQDKVEGVQMYDKRTPEIRDKRLENRDKRLEEVPLSGKPDDIPYSEIIGFLNSLLKISNKKSKGYRTSTEKTRKAIRGRWNDGFRLNDFKLVIAGQWLNWRNTNYKKFIRPETLFQPSKFEGYLNDAQSRKDIKQDLAIAKQDQVNTDDLPF